MNIVEKKLLTFSHLPRLGMILIRFNEKLTLHFPFKPNEVYFLLRFANGKETFITENLEYDQF